MKSPIAAALLVFSLIAAAQTVPAQTAPVQQKGDISSLAPPEHPATEAQIREYLTLNHAVDNAHRVMITALRGSRATSAPYLTPGFWDDMEKAVLQIDFVPLVVPAYQKYLSQEDMAAIIAFYKTPPGQRILASQQFIESTISDAARKAGEQAGIEVGKKHAEEIQRLMNQQQQQKPAAVQWPPPSDQPVNP